MLLCPLYSFFSSTQKLFKDSRTDMFRNQLNAITELMEVTINNLPLFYFLKSTFIFSTNNSQIINLIHLFLGHSNRKPSSSLGHSLGVHLSESTSNRNNNEVVKAQISLSIAIGFIICHSVKWINNILEIQLVSFNTISSSIFQILLTNPSNIRVSWDSN